MAIETFRKHAHYRTEHGLVLALGPLTRWWCKFRAAWIELDPKTLPDRRKMVWEFKIISPSAMATACQYERGDVIQAHLDDCTSPSPREWIEVTVSRRNVRTRDDYGWPAGE